MRMEDGHLQMILIPKPRCRSHEAFRRVGGIFRKVRFPQGDEEKVLCSFP